MIRGTQDVDITSFMLNGDQESVTRDERGVILKKLNKLILSCERKFRK
jgi:hypothetical protein